MAEYDPLRPLSAIRVRLPFLSFIINKWPADQQNAVANELAQAGLIQGAGVPRPPVGADYWSQVAAQPPQLPQANGQLLPQTGANGQGGSAQGASLSVQGRRKREIGLNDAREQATQAGQAAHHQLINFGANAAGNLDYLGDAAHDLWMDFHHGFDGHLNNTHQGLMAFGHGVEGLLGRVSPTLAGLWHGFQDQVDKSIDSSKDRLESLGNIVAANIQHGKQQVGASWQSIRDNVDRPLSLGLGTPVSPPSVAASPAAGFPSTPSPSLSLSDDA